MNLTTDQTPARGSVLQSKARVMGEGMMSKLVRALDWATTPLGPLDQWSETLIAMVNQVMYSPMPATLSWGPEFSFIYNEAAIPTLHGKHPAALGQSYRTVFHEAWHLVGPDIEACFQTGEAALREDVLIPILINGRMQHFYWTYSLIPIFDRGRIAGVFNAYQNTTEAVLAAQERDALARQLEQVLQDTSDSVMRIDRNWIVTYMNAHALEIARPVTNIVGRSVWESFPDLLHDDSPWVRNYHRAMDEGLSCEFEAFYPNPVNLWARVQVRPSADGITLFFNDITKQKEADSRLQLATYALKTSEEELRWTVDLSAQIRWTADPEGKILNLSPRWAQTTGYTREELLADGWQHVPHPDDLERILNAWNRSIATGSPLDVEHRMITASGSYSWVRMRAFPRQNDAGEVIKWYGTTEDIHERKLAELALLQSEKLAAVGRLASSIAHEINNPLESVTNLLYLARNTRPLSEEIDEYLDTAERELRRVSIITNQTLSFHRLSTNPTAVFCQDLIGGALSVYQGRLLNSRVIVEKRKRARTPVRCFEGEIRQVLNNLVGNAIDAMHATGGRLLIRSREATNWKTGTRGLVLTVADTGSGMPPAVQKKIFDPFFTTKGFGGTGLGLWVSCEIVTRHHGELRLRSTQHPQHHGTVFTLFLPFEAVRRSSSTTSEPSAERQ